MNEQKTNAAPRYTEQHGVGIRVPWAAVLQEEMDIAMRVKCGPAQLEEYAITPDGMTWRRCPKCFRWCAASRTKLGMWGPCRSRCGNVFKP